MTGFRIFFVFTACVLLGACADGYTRERNVVYTPKGWPMEGKGHVFRPEKGEAPVPAVLLVHGGVKIGEDGRWVMNRIAKKLARKGYFVLNITYRDGAKWAYPAPLLDVREGLEWLKKNAAEEGIDTDRIGVFGYSAGGYLGALASLTSDGDVKAIVAGATPTDLTVYANGNLIRGFLGGGGAPSEQLLYDASPLTHVTENSPPVFIYHGDDDKLVRPDHAEKFVYVLQHYGVPHEIQWVQGKGHIGTFFFPDGAVDAAIDFLDGNLK